MRRNVLYLRFGFLWKDKQINKIHQLQCDNDLFSVTSQYSSLNSSWTSSKDSDPNIIIMCRMSTTVYTSIFHQTVLTLVFCSMRSLHNTGKMTAIKEHFSLHITEILLAAEFIIYGQICINQQGTAGKAFKRRILSEKCK